MLETIELRELRGRDDDDDNDADLDDADDEDEVEKHAIEIMAPLPLLEIRGENDEACGWSSTYLTGTITIAALLLLLHNEIILAAPTPPHTCCFFCFFVDGWHMHSACTYNWCLDFKLQGSLQTVHALRQKDFAP